VNGSLSNRQQGTNVSNNNSTLNKGKKNAKNMQTLNVNNQRSSDDESEENINNSQTLPPINNKLVSNTLQIPSKTMKGKKSQSNKKIYSIGQNKQNKDGKFK